MKYAIVFLMNLMVVGCRFPQYSDIPYNWDMSVRGLPIRESYAWIDVRECDRDELFHGRLYDGFAIFSGMFWPVVEDCGTWVVDNPLCGSAENGWYRDLRIGNIYETIGEGKIGATKEKLRYFPWKETEVLLDRTYVKMNDGSKMRLLERAFSLNDMTVAFGGRLISIESDAPLFNVCVGENVVDTIHIYPRIHLDGVASHAVQGKELLFLWGNGWVKYGEARNHALFVFDNQFRGIYVYILPKLKGAYYFVKSEEGRLFLVAPEALYSKGVRIFEIVVSPHCPVTSLTQEEIDARTGRDSQRNVQN